MNKIWNGFLYLFYAIGYFGDKIAFIITCILLFNQPIFFICYVLFAIINIIINKYLINLFKEKNPNNPIKFLANDTFSKHRYGMPSIHSQNIFFSITYSYFILKQWILLLIIGIIVIYERYVFRDHTMKQLIYGALLGMLIGYLSYFILSNINSSIKENKSIESYYKIILIV